MYISKLFVSFDSIYRLIEELLAFFAQQGQGPLEGPDVQAQAGEARNPLNSLQLGRSGEALQSGAAEFPLQQEWRSFAQNAKRWEPDSTKLQVTCLQ